MGKIRNYLSKPASKGLNASLKTLEDRVQALEKLSEGYTANEDLTCALSGRVEDLRIDWSEAKDELDATYAKVHSELGHINRRRRELREDPSGAIANSTEPESTKRPKAFS